MGKLYSLSSMTELKVPLAVVGQLVSYSGDMANLSGMGAIMEVHQENPVSRYPSYDVALTDGREFKRSYLDSSRFELADAIATPDQMQVIKAAVIAKNETDKINASAAKQSFADAIAKVKADNPNLEQGEGPVVAARNIRTELKRAFPSIKLSVRTEKYSGGNSCRVEWIDGPMVEQAERITNKYRGGDFDGMTDCYNYRRSPWTEVFGEAKYVFCNRHYSDKMLSSVIGRVCRILGGMDSIPSIEDYRQGRLYAFTQSGGCDVQREINLALHKHTYCIG